MKSFLYYVRTYYANYQVHVSWVTRSHCRPWIWRDSVRTGSDLAEYMEDSFIIAHLFILQLFISKSTNNDVNNIFSIPDSFSIIYLPNS